MVSKTFGQNPFSTASRKYFVRVIITYLLMPLILLILGWDPGWWQGWIYSALIVAAGIIPRLWAEKRHPGLMEERGKLGKVQNVKSWDKVLSVLMAISVSFPLFIVAGLDHRFGWSPTFPLWFNILGLILIGLGYAIGGWAFTENRFFSSVVRIQSDRGHIVCDSGPYRFVRHPGYAGNILPLFGMMLAFSSFWIIIPILAALIIMVVRTALEDKTLQKELPGYKEYAQRVRYRLIPGIF
jgi:protein-S-isoprenylcysteine O-methyltransferase Ste14